jgi:hypothetical protein
MSSGWRLAAALASCNNSSSSSSRSSSNIVLVQHMRLSSRFYSECWLQQICAVGGGWRLPWQPAQQQQQHDSMLASCYVQCSAPRRDEQQRTAEQSASLATCRQQREQHQQPSRNVVVSTALMMATLLDTLSRLPRNDMLCNTSTPPVQSQVTSATHHKQARLLEPMLLCA